MIYNLNDPIEDTVHLGNCKIYKETELNADILKRCENNKNDYKQVCKTLKFDYDSDDDDFDTEQESEVSSRCNLDAI